MAYFSNGTEGAIYQDRYCCNCVNYRDLNDGRGYGCPIWDAHLMFLDLKKPDACAVLDHLIPREKDPPGFAAQCSMFLEASTVAKEQPDDGVDLCFQRAEETRRKNAPKPVNGEDHED